MKRIIMVLTICTVTLANAQFGVNFGIKGNAIIRASSSSWKSTDTESKLTPKDLSGFNIGVFSKIKIPIPYFSFFVMPEVYFTQYKSEANYLTSSLLGSNEIKLNANSYRIDIPILLGYDVMGIGGIFVGPVFYNQLRSLNKGISKLQNIGSAGTGDLEPSKLLGIYEEIYVSDKKTSMGYQFGISIDFIPKLTINARYEIASKNDKRTYVGEIKKDRVDYSDKPKFFIVGAGFKF